MFLCRVSNLQHDNDQVAMLMLRPKQHCENIRYFSNQDCASANTLENYHTILGIACLP